MKSICKGRGVNRVPKGREYMTAWSVGVGEQGGPLGHAPTTVHANVQMLAGR